jgi:divalent metal cation (Fe/Co/Zn/Cd) transporter
MNAQTPVGVIPASKTVRRTIEVAILRGTLENCTLDSMRRANLHKGTDRSFALTDNCSVREGHHIAHLVEDSVLRELSQISEVLVHVEPEEELAAKHLARIR